jgi:arylsulfatase A-like enzyme
MNNADAPPSQNMAAMEVRQQTAIGGRRNILILHTDQQRYDSLGCTGSRCARTPNLVRVPWRETPPRIDRTVSNVDVMPTLLAQAGIDPPACVQGQDIFDPTGEGGGEAFVYCAGRVSAW